MAKKRNIIVGQSGGPTAESIPVLPEFIRMPLNEDLTKYTECFTAFRDCWMNSILICQHRFIQNWISNNSREHHLHF